MGLRTKSKVVLEGLFLSRQPSLLPDGHKQGLFCLPMTRHLDIPPSHSSPYVASSSRSMSSYNKPAHDFKIGLRRRDLLTEGGDEGGARKASTSHSRERIASSSKGKGGVQFIRRFSVSEPLPHAA